MVVQLSQQFISLSACKLVCMDMECNSIIQGKSVCSQLIVLCFGVICLETTVMLAGESNGRRSGCYDGIY